VRRIATALLALKNAGNAKYNSWQYTFYCEFDVDGVLNKQAKAMENELQNWLEEIIQLRNNYHTLNYFTSQQLCVIRQKLGQLECKTISSLPLNVLSILMSISCRITEENVLDALKDTKGEDFDDGLNLGSNTELSASTIGQVIAEVEVNLDSAIEKKVNLLKDQLNEAEIILFNSLVDYGYSESLVYLGIKYCSGKHGKNLTERYVGNWCMKNEKKYEKMEKNALLEEINSQNISKPDCTALDNATQDDSTNIIQSENYSATKEHLTDDFFPSGLHKAARLYPNHDKAVECCIESESASISNPIFHSSVTSSIGTTEDEKRLHCTYDFVYICTKNIVVLSNTIMVCIFLATQKK